MKKLTLLSLTAIWACNTFGQVASSPKRIKVLLLGTFHFNQSLDSNSRLHFQLNTAKRQKEVEQLANKLVAFKPTKIFVEREPAEQSYWDSLYTVYKKKGKVEPVRRDANEIVQVGFRTAAKLNLPRVIGIDFQPEDYDDSTFKTSYQSEKIVHTLWKHISDYKDSIRTNAVFFDKRYPNKRVKQDSLLQKVTLSDYLIQLNLPENYTYFTWSDWNWFYSEGRKDEYIGVDWLANFWYGRNLRIYANVLRQADFNTDNTYVIIYGSTHMPFLKHLFETNPFFEVVNVEDVLDDKKPRILNKK